MYSISHPGKNGAALLDLSEDIDAEVNTESLSMHQILIERVIKRVFKEYKIPLDISTTTRSIFKSKLWRMGQALSKLGGTKRQHQLDLWKESVWSFSVDTKEMGQQFLKRKHHLETRLEKGSKQEAKNGV